jgi:hypothetical protein
VNSWNEQTWEKGLVDRARYVDDLPQSHDLQSNRVREKSSASNNAKGLIANIETRHDSTLCYPPKPRVRLALTDSGCEAWNPETRHSRTVRIGSAPVATECRKCEKVVRAKFRRKRCVFSTNVVTTLTVMYTLRSTSFFLLISRPDCFKDGESGRYPLWSRILCPSSVRSDLRTLLEKLANCPVQGCLQTN